MGVGNIIGAGIVGSMGITTLNAVDKISKKHTTIRKRINKKSSGMKYYVRTWLNNIRRYNYKEFKTLTEAQTFAQRQRNMGRTCKIFKKKIRG